MNTSIRDMWKKELAALYGISSHLLNKRLEAIEAALTKKGESFGQWRGKTMLTVKQVKTFIVYNDLPE